MAEADIQRYLDDIESQHASKPKYMSHVTALLKKVDDITRVVKDMPRAFYVREAVGAQLDVDGILVGADRRFPPVSIPGMPALLDDDTFRKVLLARIVQNGWDGTNERFKEMWDAAVGGEMDAVYRDNQDMTMDIQITGHTEPTLIEMILRGYIVPKPAGVGLNVGMSDNTILEGDALYADADFQADDAKIGVDNHLDTDTKDQDSIFADTIFGAASAIVGIENYFDTNTEDRDQVFADTVLESDSARIGVKNYLNTDTKDQDSAFAGVVFGVGSAKIGVKNYLDTDTTDQDSIHAGARLFSGAGRMDIQNHIDMGTVNAEITLSLLCAPASTARILVPMHFPDEQSARDTGSYGIHAYANSGRVAVITR